MTMNQEKTSIRYLGNNRDSLDFLGYSFRYKRVVIMLRNIISA